MDENKPDLNNDSNSNSRNEIDKNESQYTNDSRSSSNEGKRTDAAAAKEVQRARLEKIKKEKRTARMGIIGGVILMGLVATLILYLPELQNKQETKKPIQNIIIHVDDNSPIDDLFVPKEDFMIPKFMKEVEVEKSVENNSTIIKDNKNNIVMYQDGFNLSQEAKETFLYNNVNLYARFLNEYLYELHNIKDSKKYIKIDEFNNGSKTFYAVGFHEEGFYKYFVLNVYQIDEFTSALYYSYIQFEDTNEDLYPTDNVSIDRHRQILEVIFKDVK